MYMYKYHLIDIFETYLINSCIIIQTFKQFYRAEKVFHLIPPPQHTHLPPKRYKMCNQIERVSMTEIDKILWLTDLN